MSVGPEFWNPYRFLLRLLGWPLVGAALFAGTVWLLWPRIELAMRPVLLTQMEERLSDTERYEMTRQIAEGFDFWEVHPNPDVAGLAQRNRTGISRGTEVRTNNAGMRASREYSAKPDSVFRVVCLGDSFVFGMGAPEEDRFCDQLESFYRAHSVRPDGRTIETLAIGLPGWTLVQSTTYLASHITNYDPDVVIVVSAPNDITDNYAVTGRGTLTGIFSPERASFGSATFSNEMNSVFGESGNWSSLAWDLSPASRQRWDKAMGRLGRLVELQSGRDKHTLVSALVWGNSDEPDFFPSLFHAQFRRARISAPFVMTSFLPGTRTRLKQDNHPNRLGNQLLRDQYLHALNRLGWISVPDSVLPKLDRRTPVRLDPELDEPRLERFRREFLLVFTETLDFTTLRPVQTRAFLGGLSPETPRSGRELESAPWASIRAAFLLRRPEGRPLTGVEVQLEIPPRPELFPFELVMLLDGVESARVTWASPNETGRYSITGAPKVSPFSNELVEVMLETGSYFSTIDDVRMKSYRPLRARTF